MGFSCGLTKVRPYKTSGAARLIHPVPHLLAADRGTRDFRGGGAHFDHAFGAAECGVAGDDEIWRRGFLGTAARIHSHHLVPRIGGWLSGSREYRYLQQSVAAFPPPDEFAALMRASGLDVIDVIPLTFGVCNLYIATPSEDA